MHRKGLLSAALVSALMFAAGCDATAQTQSGAFSSGVAVDATSTHGPEPDPVPTGSSPPNSLPAPGESAEGGIMPALPAAPVTALTAPAADHDYARLIEHLKAEADQGSAGAAYALGSLYEHGVGVSRDCSLAMSYYKSAAEKGNSDAANDLGAMYDGVRGVRRELS